jgi:hypothetical protein
MYERCFAIHAYMRMVPFPRVVTTLHEFYRAVELVQSARSQLDTPEYELLQRQAIGELGSRLFPLFSVSLLAEYNENAPKGLERSERFPGVLRGFPMDRLVDEVHALYATLKPVLDSHGLDLGDLYEGKTVKARFFSVNQGLLPEKLFWLRSFGLGAYRLLSACVDDCFRRGEEDACPWLGLIRN